VNKIFLCFFFLSLHSYARTVETVVLLKELGINGKMLGKNVVIMNEGSLLINKEKLSDVEIVTESRHISNIASFEKSEQTNSCITGTFVHLIKFKNNIKNEEGCLEGKRFKSLKASFRALKKKWMIKND
jgi:hypothetical protein